MSSLVVQVTDANGRAAAAPGLGRWIVRHAPAGARGMVGIALVGDRTMRRLNRQYRGIDRPTDVLSFPAAGAAAAPDIPRSRMTFTSGGRRSPAPDDARRHRTTFARAHLGDIAIATGVARRQARAHGHPVATELRVLALHGLLHLLGYDHETDQGQMQRAEDRLRRRAGLRTGLIGRRR